MDAQLVNAYDRPLPPAWFMLLAWAMIFGPPLLQLWIYWKIMVFKWKDRYKPDKPPIQVS